MRSKEDSSLIDEMWAIDSKIRAESRRIKPNAEYSPEDYETIGAVLKLIIQRAEKGLLYGPDMPSSRHAVLNDIRELADMAFVDAVIRIGGQ